MPTYEVMMELTVGRAIEVEAASEADAKVKAKEWVSENMQPEDLDEQVWPEDLEPTTVRLMSTSEQAIRAADRC
jgi:hypothetical protein